MNIIKNSKKNFILLAASETEFKSLSKVTLKYLTVDHSQSKLPFNTMSNEAISPSHVSIVLLRSQFEAEICCKYSDLYIGLTHILISRLS